MPWDYIKDEKKGKKIVKIKKLATPILLILIFVLFNGFVVFAGQQQQEKLSAMRKTGVTTLNKIVDVKDYRKKEAKKLEIIINDSEAVINKARDKKVIDEEIKSAELKIKKLKTNAQYKKEEKAAAEKKKREAEEAARRAAEEAARLEAARQAAEAANASNQTTTNSNRGCIGNDSSNFY